MSLRFDKMSGAGNDFVLIEGRGSAALARRLCHRRLGVGADGLLAVSRRPSLNVRYFNADGSEAFCGNGSRCAAWWMFRKGWTRGKEFEFATSEGVLRARMLPGGRAAIHMPEPKILRSTMAIRISGSSYDACWIDTGVPHAVIFVKDLAKVPVETLGRAVRFHEAFGKPGANADFAAVGAKGLSVRTYERGVEGETLACGTGAVATALAACELGRAKSPVPVRVASGQTLRVHFKRTGSGFYDVWLEGPAEIVFSGEIDS